VQANYCTAAHELLCSGAGELAGLVGKMNIIIIDGKHSYEFESTLADTSSK
jgi:hypothetical protein